MSLDFTYHQVWRRRLARSGCRSALVVGWRSPIQIELKGCRNLQTSERRFWSDDCRWRSGLIRWRQSLIAWRGVAEVRGMTRSKTSLKANSGKDISQSSSKNTSRYWIFGKTSWKIAKKTKGDQILISCGCWVDIRGWRGWWWRRIKPNNQTIGLWGLRKETSERLCAK